MKALTTLLVVGMFLTTVAMADDVDDVKAAVQGHFAAVNAGDVNAYIQYYPSETSRFAGGGLLARVHSLEERRNDFQAGVDARVDAGVKRNLELQHMEVKVYGTTAVVTGYLVGTSTAADGTVTQSRQQRTEVLIKQGGQWKSVHNHRSPLFPR